MTSSPSPAPISRESESSQSSDLSDLDSEIFADFEAGGIPTSSTSIDSAQRKRKRIQTAKTTWSYAREHTGSEPERYRDGRKIFYCKQCPWFNTITTNIRNHLRREHGILIEEKESMVKQATTKKLTSLFRKQAEIGQQKLDINKERILQSAVNKRVVQEALAQLIVMRNLPYTATE